MDRYEFKEYLSIYDCCKCQLGIDNFMVSIKLQMQELREPLLAPPRESVVVSVTLLLSTLLASGAGMLLIKWSQVASSQHAFYAGYVCEFIAFGLYPLNLQRLSMIIVVVAWSTSSCIFALVGNVLLTGERPNGIVVLGSLLSILGATLVVKNVNAVHGP